MSARRRKLWIALWLAPLTVVGASRARAQAPTLPAPTHHDPGSVVSSLGPTPGAGANPFGSTPGTDPAFLGGRAGPSFPRVPTSITTPGGVGGMNPTPGIAAPARLKITEVPLYGPLEVPAVAEEEGPPGGLTLDAAVDRLVRENLALQARRWQIPASRADVLTASLRANPVLYADAQLVPYGRYTRDRPGGQTQYDVNVSHPVDYSGKRQARTASARIVLTVQETLYQDAVRVEIDNLYTAFVDVLSARETIRYARASRVGLERLLRINETLFRKSTVTRPDVGRARALLDASDLAILDAEETLRRTRRTLGTLLNLPPDQADRVQVRGTIADLGQPPPPVDDLVRFALTDRPDLAAQRLGVARARAEVRVARANRFGDAYVLAQPYTYQDNSPIGLKSPTSWALGLTVPLPVYNRNQGGMARAALNVDQTLNEVAAMERRVAAEVRAVEREYALTRDQLLMIDRDLLPAARRLRDDTLELFIGGEVTALDADNARKEYNQAVRQYRDTLIRHRRGMLALNTAVARRILP
jgi:cobalt-zinc-cadmium efflux system outer membrane protein